MILFAGLTDPDNVFEHQWAENDFVVWNNRVVIHSATSKGLWKQTEDDERLLHRIRMRAHPVHGRVAAWAPVVEAAGHGFGERIVTGPGDEEDEQGEGVAAASVAASQDPRGDARL
jgi:hypothetical protein